MRKTTLIVGTTLVATCIAYLPVQAQPAESLLVRADQPIRTFVLRAGFSHGWQDPYPLNDSLVATLKPRMWRLNKYYSYETAIQFGADITFLATESYAFANGGYPNVNPWDDWEGMEAYVTAILEFYASEFPDHPPAYYDIWNEPDHSYFWHGTYEQMLETFARVHGVIKTFDSTAKVVGPSISWFRPGNSGVEGIIDFLVDLDTIYGVRLDAITWHENGGVFSGGGKPDLLYFDAQYLRSQVAANFPPEYQPEYHTNEFSGTQMHLSPGFTAGYYFYLEAARIDQAMRACWNSYSNDPPPPYAWSTCWAGLNGMFMRDGTTPTAVYWVRKAYADMEGQQLLSSGSNHLWTTVIAARDDASETLSMITGRYFFFDTMDVSLTVAGVPWNYPKVHVRIQRVPHRAEYYDNPPLVAGLPGGPELVSAQNVVPVNGDIGLTLQNYAEGDAYLITVSKPVCAIALTGDLDASGLITSADIIHGVNYVFKAGTEPVPCEAAADVDCSGGITSADVIGIVNHVFKAGALPCDVCTLSLPAACY